MGKEEGVAEWKNFLVNQEMPSQKVLGSWYMNLTSSCESYSKGYCVNTNQIR